MEPGPETADLEFLFRLGQATSPWRTGNDGGTTPRTRSTQACAAHRRLPPPFRLVHDGDEEHITLAEPPTHFFAWIRLYGTLGEGRGKSPPAKGSLTQRCLRAGAV